jgi:hypothetical protein
MSQVMLEALEGLGETDTFAAAFDAGSGRVNELPSVACDCLCCVVCNGAVFAVAPFSIESEIAA